MRIPTITTSRLILRALAEEDIGPLHCILGDRDVLRYFPNTNPPTRDRVQKLISGQLKHWEERGYGWWAIELRSQNELIGWSGLQFLPETEEVEVAYLLGKAFWGKGLATEAARAGLQYGFEDIELESIVAIVHPENIASQRVIEKLGMLFVDQSHYFGMDCYRYSIERSSFDSEAGLSGPVASGGLLDQLKLRGGVL
jgi:RimJ/RimL family protein N-acetyltransferase